MSDFVNFIESLSDHELAIFRKYRYRGFLEKSREKLDNELKKRKLSIDILESHAQRKLNATLTNDAKRCPRCGSEKLFTETSFSELPFNEFSSVEVANNTYRCRLCGFNPEKETSKDFFERLKRGVRNLTNLRFSKWNSI